MPIQSVSATFETLCRYFVASISFAVSLTPPSKVNCCFDRPKRIFLRMSDFECGQRPQTACSFARIVVHSATRRTGHSSTRLEQEAIVTPLVPHIYCSRGGATTATNTNTIIRLGSEIDTARLGRSAQNVRFRRRKRIKTPSHLNLLFSQAETRAIIGEVGAPKMSLSVQLPLCEPTKPLGIRH